MQASGRKNKKEKKKRGTAAKRHASKEQKAARQAMRHAINKKELSNPKQAGKKTSTAQSSVQSMIVDVP